MSSAVASGLEELILEVRRYNPEADEDQIRRAYEFADSAHAGQKRLTGEPFVTHPLAVAQILAEIDSDTPTLLAALLHDTVEDNGEITIEDVRGVFGDAVAHLVDGVTKLKGLSFRSRVENQAQNFRKMFVAMARDIRVVIIKLADRLHNMRTIGVFPEAKKRSVAEETLRIYAPLASRLGIRHLQWQLEDLSLEVIDPKAYREIQYKVVRTRREREEAVDKLSEQLRERLGAAGIPAEVHGRPKHFHSIYRKMIRDELDFEQVFDLIALRVMVFTVPECYAALGVVHEMWVPLPEMVTDFIAKPKANGYQSLHTKVIGPEGSPLEVQIRTWEMHRTCEYGIAAHWAYKEGGVATTDFDRKLSWLRQILELQTDVPEDAQFMRSIEEDLFQEQVFVFTPKGELVELTRGATPVDFAYRIHTQLGHECVGAKANGKQVPLTYELRNGDICEIVRRRGSQPSRDWLSFVQTSHARAKIRSFFRKLSFEEHVKAGRALLERELSREGDEPSVSDERLLEVAESLNYQSLDTMLAHIGSRDLNAQTVILRLRAMETEERIRSLGELQLVKRRGGRSPGEYDITAAGIDGVAFTLARCCEPLPGDPIIGYITRGRGLKVHRPDCHNLRNLMAKDGSRMVSCEWVVPEGATHPARLEVIAGDRVGMLRDITELLTDLDLNITDISITSRQAGRAIMHMTVEVGSAAQLSTLISRLEAIQDLVSVRRIPR
ncbi:MAG: RelA/SpoT family protein [Armatimonadia bacterium]|nr:RelA/SpoT family protein [Armatimonadia bacterium]